VHADANGKERAVVAMRIDPGNAASPFFNQFPAVPAFDDSTTATAMEMDPMMAINEVNNFSEFWTYQGSLTSPPCTEGIRWFVARNVLFVSVEQMQAILAVSTYSARAEQEAWQHQINV
jgi:carbonic anhydrase